ncbi:hypothetical protein U14_03026 [Candidatus Moduliflexus flocculans]|uniref:IrrE N-terminal-like domain-containing protein n=1 Tax=Candidatus Moduliflexus flocculans TaxID=1499966 RepID=A0A081BN14_9BACT|nr:hypothetical protein U14_03026 [Candidatus Moduliflexus flocculans]
MISKHLLNQAKAFLCWDAFPEVAIQLAPIQAAVAYYYPPSPDVHSIVVFYQPDAQDFSPPFFLLFHEIGHYLQYQAHQRAGTLAHFYAALQADNGAEKATFERDSWERGAVALNAFFERHQMKKERLLAEYAAYADRCVMSYQ